MRARSGFVDYWLQYVPLRLVAMVLGMFPVETNLRVMRRLGSIWYWLPHALPEMRLPEAVLSLPGLTWLRRVDAGLNRALLRFRAHRERAEEHIQRSFPEFDERRVQQVAKASMEHLAMLAVEVLMTPRLVTTWSWARYIELRDLAPAIRVLLERRGCIMLTGHYGNWELLGYALAMLGFDITALMRPFDNPHLNEYLLDRRVRSGLKLLYKKGATREAPQVIESGGSLCFIADQNAGSKGMFVDFFGRKASTYKSIGLLAMQYERPIVVGCSRRIGKGLRYEIGVNRIIRPEEWAEQDDPLRWITQTYTTALEDLVREAPEQYLWIHRRWKSRPRDELETAGAKMSRTGEASPRADALTR